MRFFSILALLAVLAASLFGQAATGAITGIVSDPTGAVVANASVEVKNTETGVVYPTVTTSTGEYTVTRLPLGRYEASASGGPGLNTLRLLVTECYCATERGRS